MVEKLKTENHHWWPQALSKFWTDDDGRVHRLSVNGDHVPSTPKALAAVRNLHNITLADTPTPWDSSYERTFDRADNGFATLIPWLQAQSAPIQPSEAPFPERLSPVIVPDAERLLLGECLASLIVRSPSLRDRVRITTEYYRGRFGMADPTADKNLISSNIMNGQPKLAREMATSGKFTILLSDEDEFIFGDGFLHSVHQVNDPILSLRCLIPVTPNIALFYTRPMSYRSYPVGFALDLSADEVSLVNETVQIYSNEYLFYRSHRPTLGDAFKLSQHQQFEYHKHPWLEALQHAMAETYFGDDRDFYAR